MTHKRGFFDSHFAYALLGVVPMLAFVFCIAAEEPLQAQSVEAPAGSWGAMSVEERREEIALRRARKRAGVKRGALPGGVNKFVDGEVTCYVVKHSAEGGGGYGTWGSVSTSISCLHTPEESPCTIDAYPQ